MQILEKHIPQHQHKKIIDNKSAQQAQVITWTHIQGPSMHTQTHAKMAASPVSIGFLFALDDSAALIYIQRKRVVPSGQ